MTTQDELDYQRIERAIVFLKDNFKEQPTLEQIADIAHLSPFHFQRMFTQWAGVSPKKFQQFLSLEYAKRLLKDRTVSLLDAAHETGLSGTGRLHDLFVKIEAMTPGQYKNSAQGLRISYQFAQTLFGQVIIGATDQGVCHVFFAEDRGTALKDLQAKFGDARLLEKTNDHIDAVIDYFASQGEGEINLHLCGTAFQLKVWSALLNIPAGEVTTYGDLATQMGQNGAARAVGSAVGRNPVAVLIPCHRVIRQDGQLGGYMWGLNRKTALLGWEAARYAARD